MDSKEWITSGVLEQYLMGQLSPKDERRLVSALSKDPALREQMAQLEEDLERMGLDNAIAPPASVKEAVMQVVESEAERQGGAKVRSLRQSERNTYFAMAASLAVLFMLATAWLYMQYSGLQKAVVTTENELNDLRKELDGMSVDYEETLTLFETINDPSTSRYLMTGNDRSPASTVVSYVNHNSGTVLLNTSGLAQLDETHDYQLWGDIDGEMINMGVIPRGTSMAPMTYLAEAESLNITIEPAGGSDHPTVSQLITSVSLAEAIQP